MNKKKKKSAKTKAPAAPVEIKSLTDLTPDDKNANRGTERGDQMIERSLNRLGFGRPIVADRAGKIIAGNKTYENLLQAGFSVEPIVVKTDGTRPIVHQRTDLDMEGGDSKARELAIADNRASEVGLSWDPVILGMLAEKIELNEFFTEAELKAIFPESPEQFKEVDENIAVQHCCPKCGYQWSGDPNAGQKRVDIAEAKNAAKS